MRWGSQAMKHGASRPNRLQRTTHQPAALQTAPCCHPLCNLLHNLTLAAVLRGLPLRPCTRPIPHAPAAPGPAEHPDAAAGADRAAGGGVLHGVRLHRRIRPVPHVAGGRAGGVQLAMLGGDGCWAASWGDRLVALPGHVCRGTPPTKQMPLALRVEGSGAGERSALQSCRRDPRPPSHMHSDVPPPPPPPQPSLPASIRGPTCRGGRCPSRAPPCSRCSW